MCGKCVRVCGKAASFNPQKVRNRLFALIMLVFATATLEAFAQMGVMVQDPFS